MLGVVTDIPLNFVSPAKLLMVYSVHLWGKSPTNLTQKNPKTTKPSMFLVHEIFGYRGIFTVLHWLLYRDKK